MRITLYSPYEQLQKKLLFVLFTVIVIATGSVFLCTYYDLVIIPQRLIPAHHLSSQASSVPILNRVLHPRDHVYRQAKTIHYEWVVTAGIRSPDRIEKRVYLVNGM